MSLVLVISAIILMVSMFICCFIKKGIPSCISDCYYIIGRWFTLVMLLVAFLILPNALERNDSIITFIMCSGIAFVGVASDYLRTDEYKVHYTSALLSTLCCVPFVYVVRPWCLWFLLIALIGIIDKRRWLLYSELACFVSVFVALLV